MGNSSPSSILVTGANGQLGKELKILASANPQFQFSFLSKEVLPIHNSVLLRKFFQEINPGYCINCAAYTAVDRAEEEKGLAFLINAEAVGQLANICKEYDSKLIHISTDYVFDGAASTPYMEEDATNPKNVYGVSKLEGEKHALLLNPGSIIIRTSWLYSEFGKNFVKTMLKLMNEKKEISVVNDQIGSPTYAYDLGEVIISMIDNKSAGMQSWIPGIYHFSNEGAITWYDFAIAIKELSGSSCKINPVTSEFFPTVAKRPDYSVLDKTKIQQTFGIKLKDWRESLADCLHKIKKDNS